MDASGIINHFQLNAKVPKSLEIQDNLLLRIRKKTIEDKVGNYMKTNVYLHTFYNIFSGD